MVKYVISIVSTVSYVMATLEFANNITTETVYLLLICNIVLFSDILPRHLHLCAKLKKASVDQINNNKGVFAAYSNDARLKISMLLVAASLSIITLSVFMHINVHSNAPIVLLTPISGLALMAAVYVYKLPNHKFLMLNTRQDISLIKID